jgi:hypothetical protein
MFTWDEIKSDWLDGSRLDLSAAEVTQAFNNVAIAFGRQWIESWRCRNGMASRGASPTIHLTMLGQMLSSLSGATNAENLLKKIRKDLPDARAELLAIHLLRAHNHARAIEIEPSIVVNGRNRMPDFRIRDGDEDWTYVEATRAGTSEAQAQVRRSLDRLTGLVETCVGTFSLEVFLKREPTSAELDILSSTIVTGQRDRSTREDRLNDDLGSLYWNVSAPGDVRLDDHGEPYTPRLSSARLAMLDDAKRHIVVRWPFTDVRAEETLRIEARQLPKDSPGLVMIQTTGATGAMKAWRGLIERRLQPNLHTRVSAVCLISSGLYNAPGGERWAPKTKLILNPFAHFSLPSWIHSQLEEFTSDEVDIAI